MGSNFGKDVIDAIIAPVSLGTVVGNTIVGVVVDVV